MLLDHGQVSRDGNPSEICGVFYQEAQERNIARHTVTNVEGQITPQRGVGSIQVEKIEFLNDEGQLVEGAGTT